MTKIIVDAMGADAGAEMVAEALRQARLKREFDAVIVGPEAQLAEVFAEDEHVEVLDAQDFISNDEAPAFAVRRKKDASIVKALRRLNEDGDVLVTAGSTGALLAGGYLITKRLAGMERLCLAVTVPHDGGDVLLADAGATMDTSPEILLQFAQLVAHYAEATLKKTEPRVSLLNIGVESEKGDQRAVKTYELLQKSSLHFVGNVEARDILTAPVDVIITDGFAGNIALKTLEGTGRYFLHILKKVMGGAVPHAQSAHADAHYAHPSEQVGDASNTPAGASIGAQDVHAGLKASLQNLDYRAHGGAPLLGARKALYKAHGNSTVETFTLAIFEALDFAESGVIERLKALSETEE